MFSVYIIYFFLLKRASPVPSHPCHEFRVPSIPWWVIAIGQKYKSVPAIT